MQKINICLAPMDGITDMALRKTLSSNQQFVKYTPDIIFTEFINVEALHRNIKSAKRAMLKLINDDITSAQSDFIDQLNMQATQTQINIKDNNEDYRNSSKKSCKYKENYTEQYDSFKVKFKGKQIAQLYGKNPKLFADATEKIVQLGYDGVDINMGCPAKKIARRMEGAGLIKTPDIALEIIDQVKKAVKITKAKDDFTISVKTRLGFDSDIAEEWLSLLDNQNLSFITLHARTFAQGYTGSADWSRIKDITKILKTKLIGNGDIASVEDAVEKQKKLDLYGVMIGRNYNAFIKSDRLSRLTALQYFLLNHKLLISKYFRSLDSAYASAKKVIVTFLKFLESKNNLQYNLLCVKSYEEAFELIDKEINTTF